MSNMTLYTRHSRQDRCRGRAGAAGLAPATPPCALSWEVVERALSDLAAIFADPGAPAAAAKLAALRARWPQLAPPEREALTPIARLAAQRVEAATSRPATDPDEDAYLAHLASMEATIDAEVAAGSAPEAPLGAKPRGRPTEAPSGAGPRGDTTKYPSGAIPRDGTTKDPLGAKPRGGLTEDAFGAGSSRRGTAEDPFGGAQAGSPDVPTLFAVATPPPPLPARRLASARRSPTSRRRSCSACSA